MATTEFNVTDFLDNQKIGGFFWTVLVLCALVALFDGYDAFAMGFVIPALAKDFGVGYPALTTVLVLQGIGIALGVYLICPLADRFGRRPILLMSALMFGLLTIGAAFTHSVNELAAVRFVSGLFMGSAFPLALAIPTEYSPVRLKATFLPAVTAGYTAGISLGGLVSANILTTYGWQGIFWVGGALPLILLPFCYFILPESLRFNVLRGDRSAEVARIIKRIDPAAPVDATTRFQVREERSARIPVVELFREGRARPTVLLWIGFFMNLFGLILWGAWTPTFLHNFVGLPLDRAAVLMIVGALSGIFVSLFFGRLVDLYGAWRVMALAYFLGGLSFLGLGGLAGDSFSLLFVFTVALGATSGAAQCGIMILAALAYPTRMRATGLGWAFGAGRIGTILGPLTGGMLLAYQWSEFASFGVVAVALFIASLCMLIGSFGPVVAAAPEPVAGRS